MTLMEVEPQHIYIAVDVPDYTVQWKDYDNTVLETDLNVMEGTTPTYDGATPTRSGYTFTGWSPTPAPIYANTDYIAQYRAPVYDMLVLNVSNRYTSINTGSYFYGVTFYAKTTCQITQIQCMYWSDLTEEISGTLKITLGGNLSGTGTTYTIPRGGVSSSGVYVLPQPYQLTSGNHYSIGMAGQLYSVESQYAGYPYVKDCTNVRYDYSINTYDNTATTAQVFLIAGLQTE